MPAESAVAGVNVALQRPCSLIKNRIRFQAEVCTIKNHRILRRSTPFICRFLRHCTPHTWVMQDKLLRTLVLTCLHQAMTSYLARLGPRLTQDKVHRWLAKANKPILLNLRKGNLGFPEQQASCSVIVHRVSLGLCVKQELLQAYIVGFLDAVTSTFISAAQHVSDCVLN